jgi:hypothetical protein
MTSREMRYYKALRHTWNEPAHRALEMARDKYRAEQAGIEFHWEPEQENPRDVFGEPDPVNGPFYDPDAEFYACIARKGEDGPVLDSLGMIDGAWDRSDFGGYWFYVECGMAGEALSNLDKLMTEPEYDNEESLS